MQGFWPKSLWTQQTLCPQHPVSNRTRFNLWNTTSHKHGDGSKMVGTSCLDLLVNQGILLVNSSFCNTTTHHATRHLAPIVRHSAPSAAVPGFVMLRDRPQNFSRQKKTDMKGNKYPKSKSNLQERFGLGKLIETF